MIVRLRIGRWCYVPLPIIFLPAVFSCCSSRRSQSFCREASHDPHAAPSHQTGKDLFGFCSVCADALGIFVIWPICLPQPSSDGCRPSAMNPSTDHVLMNLPRDFGVWERCVSRSAPKALLRIILPFEGHNRPFFEHITI